jgi:hypothetical protein
MFKGPRFIKRGDGILKPLLVKLKSNQGEIKSTYRKIRKAVYQRCTGR